MTNRKKIMIIILGLAMLLALGLAIFLTRHSNNKQSSDNKTVSKQKIDQTKPLKAPVAPTSGTIHKQACDLLTEKLAIATVGQGAAKNNKLPSLQGQDFRASSCEYAATNKKVTVSLYEYTTADKAVAAKDSDATQQTVSEDGGKTTSIQPKTSAAEVKNKFVVTVTVMSGDKFDSDSSQKLLKDITGKLR